MLKTQKIFCDPDSPSSYDSTYVPHQALVTSSSKEPIREVGMLRNTREYMGIIGHVFDRRHPRRDHDEISELFKKFGKTIENRWPCRGFWQKKELRIVGAMNHCNQYLYLGLVSMTNHAAGVGTCTQKWHDNSDLSLFGDASEKIPDQTEFQSWIVNFRAEGCAKAKNLAKSGPKKSRQRVRWRTSSIQNQSGEKFPWLWRIGFDDGGRIETVLR